MTRVSRLRALWTRALAGLSLGVLALACTVLPDTRAVDPEADAPETEREPVAVTAMAVRVSAKVLDHEPAALRYLQEAADAWASVGEMPVVVYAEGDDWHPGPEYQQIRVVWQAKPLAHPEGGAVYGAAQTPYLGLFGSTIHGALDYTEDHETCVSKVNTSLRVVLTHELGHLLGREHSDARADIMYGGTTCDPHARQVTARPENETH